MSQPVLLLFLIIGLGVLAGRIRFGKIRLGGSAVLVVGLVFGHFGFTLPPVFQTFGVVLFVYTVGLKAGPYFLSAFKQAKANFLILVVLIAGTAGAATFGFGRLFGIEPKLMIGIYAGSMTSTPALAAAAEALDDAGVSVGYGLAYPVGILCVILMVQVLPGLFRIDLKKEEADFKAVTGAKPIVHKVYRVTNGNATSGSLSEVLSLMPHTYRLVRIHRGDKTFTPQADEALRIGDVVLAVGYEDELKKLNLLLGREEQTEVPYSTEAASRWMRVASKKFVGRGIESMEVSQLFGVILTRVRRGEIEFSPSSKFVLEAGDEIRVSGSLADIQRFEKLIQKDAETLDQTDMVSLAAGLILGILFSWIRIPINERIYLGLGIAGGPLVAGLFFGYFGRFGVISGRMPRASVLLAGDLGLYLFLAASGCAAGAAFVSVLLEQGVLLLIGALVIAILPIVAAVLVGRYLLKMNFLVLLGAVCGGMTSTPALGVLTQNTRSEVPALGYTGIYPLAVLLVTLTAQLLCAF